MRLLAIAVVLVVACTVDRRSTSLECTTSGDCNNGRTCDQGYCVGSGGPPCPKQCTSCSGTGTVQTCNITGTGSGTIACPAGFNCNVTCPVANACGTVQCTTDACTVNCMAAMSCGTIECSSSCGCQVNCPAGNCGTNNCPTGAMGAACVNGSACSTSPRGCNSC